MLNETSMLYKLTILYILSRVDFPMSNSQISNFILENDYTDYFNIQQIMGELIDDGYVSREAIHSRTLYRLTDAGEAALKMLSRELSPAMKADVDEYIRDNKMQLKDELAVKGSYYQEDIDRYIAHLYVEEEDAKLLEINVAARSAEEADSMCAGWQKNCERIYRQLMGELLK